MSDHTNFGDILRAARLAQGLTIDELSSRSGVGRRNIAYLEKGQTNPAWQTMMLLSMGLGANLDISFKFEKREP